MGVAVLCLVGMVSDTDGYRAGRVRTFILLLSRSAFNSLPWSSSSRCSAHTPQALLTRESVEYGELISDIGFFAFIATCTDGLPNHPETS